MSGKFPYLFLFFVVLFSLFIGNFFKKIDFFDQKKKCFVFSQEKLTNLYGSNDRVPLRKNPAPLDSASEQELADFPDARVIECSETEGPEPGTKTRKRILKTKFKYPYIYTEEIIDDADSHVLSRTESVADHLLVQLAGTVDPVAFLEECGSEAISLERVTPNNLLYRLKLSDHSLETLPRILEKVATLPNLAEFGEPDFVCHARLRPNNPFYLREQWYLNSTAIVDGFPLGISMEKAWDIQTSAPSVIIAILDTGINFNHEGLASNIWTNPYPQYNDLHGWSSITNDGNCMDNHGHGTMCAGIIGALGNNNKGIAGIVWKTQLMSCKFLTSTGSGVDSDSIACINYACDHHATILNCSWGHQGGYSESLKAAFKRTHDEKIIVVVAAGNDGFDSDIYPDYPSSYHFDNMVTVAATNMYNKLSLSSDYGANTVLFAAPGDNIFSTSIGSNHSYNYGSGTSFAAPHVTGALALLKARFSYLQYDELITHLAETSDKIPFLKDKVKAGRINVGRALTTVPDRCGCFSPFYWWY